MTKQPSSQTDQHAAQRFWYSPRTALALLACLFAVVHTLSWWIPPFQSPDEFFHVERAYLLSKGEVILGKHSGVTGGRIDTALLDYMKTFQNIRWFAYEDATLRAQRSPLICLGQTLRWRGESRFERVPNTAVYFPLPYVPQAIAFFIGERAGLTVSHTYYLARLFSLLATLTLVWFALRTYPVSPFVLALFITPMNLIQLGSASLDAVSFGTCALAAALFCRGCDRELSFRAGMQVALFLCLLVLATSRMNLIILTLLPVVLYGIRRSRSHLVSAAALIVVAVSWILFVQGDVHSGNGHDSATTRQIVQYYLTHVDEFLRVLFATIMNPYVLQSYWYMFIGLVGWSGIEVVTAGTVKWYGSFLHPAVYLAWSVLLPTLALLSLQRDRSTLLGRAGLALFASALVASFLIFPILLATWAPHPASLIVGVQGRYFTPIMLLLGFSVFSGCPSQRSLTAALAASFVLLVASAAGLARDLHDTYWITEPGAAAQHTDCGKPHPGFEATWPFT